MSIQRPQWKQLVASIAVTGLVLPLPSAGLQTASMKLPPDFAETALHLPVTGYGGANRGQFRVGDYGGEFTRIESRLAIFDPLYESNRGKASFALQGPGISGTVSAECSFKENVVTVGIITFDPKKFAFVCDLSGNNSDLRGRLTLGQLRPEGLKERVLARATRRGQADIGDLQIGIESVHEYAGSRLQASIPVGYLLTHDSLVVGALELTDINPTIFLAGDLSGQVSQATLITAIGVSLLRDPANSTLGD